ncbi:MAG: class I SAM-dependent methyltransferase [Candidatus Saccharibacteria bacterium]|nr:class I SAM-dependent methyltransferase [Candidatus Saccharibacteria bacterium]
MSTIKKALVRIPVLGYLLRLGLSIVQLPRYITQLKDTAQKNTLEIENLKQKTTRANTKIIELIENNATLESELITTHRKISELKIHSEKTHSKPVAVTNEANMSDAQKSNILADDHSLDDFYVSFEDSFRGSEQVILERLQVYVPYFKALKKINSSKKPVLDIGCGRGEFLELMKTNKLDAIGLDLNETMVKLSVKRGFKATQANAISYMADQKAKSFSAITGFHIVEHIHFSELLQLFKESYRALENDGFVLFETPNPENLSVGAFSFYYDPSHLRPIPPEFLKFCLTYVGFKKVKIIPLHPALEVSYEDEVINSTVKKLFGPQDYAVIGYK